MIIWLLPGIYVYLPGGEQYYPVDPQSKYHAGQVIAGDEASRLINISDDNYFVRNAIADVMSRTGESYTTGSVIAYRYLEKSPFNTYDLLHPHYYKVLPAVEYVFGGVWDRGVNLYAFIDPDKNRVAYIGYTARLGIEGRNYSYETVPEGISLVETYYQRFPVFQFSNFTIIDTGYNPSYNMSCEQEDELLAIALNDSRVSDLLRDHLYVPKVNVMASAEAFLGQDDYYYGKCYPGVTFSTNDTGNLSFYMSVVIDPLNKTVTSIFQPVT